jgi:hypothetical protein
MCYSLSYGIHLAAQLIPELKRSQDTPTSKQLFPKVDVNIVENLSRRSRSNYSITIN